MRKKKAIVNDIVVTPDTIRDEKIGNLRYIREPETNIKRPARGSKYGSIHRILPITHKAIHTLHECGWTQLQIAAALGVCLNTVRIQLHREITQKKKKSRKTIDYWDGTNPYDKINRRGFKEEGII